MTLFEALHGIEYKTRRSRIAYISIDIGPSIEQRIYVDNKKN